MATRMIGAEADMIDCLQLANLSQGFVTYDYAETKVSQICYAAHLRNTRILGHVCREDRGSEK